MSVGGGLDVVPGVGEEGTSPAKRANDTVIAPPLSRHKHAFTPLLRRGTVGCSGRCVENRRAVAAAATSAVVVAVDTTVVVLLPQLEESETRKFTRRWRLSRVRRLSGI